MKAIEYNNDGTITATIGGKAQKLGPATLGQYKRLKSLLVELNDDLRARNDEIQKRNAERLENGEGASSLELQDDGETVLIGWHTEAFKLLGGELPEDVDEWPTWLATSGKLPGEFLAHMRAVPLDLG